MGIGFHGRAAASKPDITKHNVKRQMCCKARQKWRRIRWNEKSDFSVGQSVGQVEVLLEEGSKIHRSNLKRVEAVVAAKDGPT